MAAILRNVDSARSTPGDAAAARAISPTRIASFDPSVIARVFGPTATTMGSLANRDVERANLRPYAPMTDLGSMFGTDSAPVADAVERYRASRQKQQDEALQKRNQVLANPMESWTW